VRILLLGAAGFIGRELAGALAARGHELVAAVRRAGWVAPLGVHAVTVIDLNRATRPEDWSEALRGCDAVVNCAGILQGTRAQSMRAIHAAAPIALFRACERAGVRRVVQVSAISAERAAGTEYAASKLEADEFLRSTSLDWVVLRPSLVFTRGAYGGTALFRAMAALPFAIPVPGSGEQRFQPIHVRDLARVVVEALEGTRLVRRTVDPVGPEVVTLRQVLEDYRRWLGFEAVPFVPMPAWIVRTAARVGDHLGGPINSTAVAQLEFGNVGDAAAFESASGCGASGWRAALAAEPAHAQDRWHARLYFVRPLLRAALVALWLVSGLAGLFALDEWAPRLAAATAMPASFALAALGAACGLDLVFAALVAGRWRPRRLALLQLLAIGAYTALATALWPALWAEPLGPLLKNLPIAAAVAAWGAIEEEC
jgi:uncharacterized protein YbjT (DUF2867 family)